MELGEYLLQGRLLLTTPAHVLAASPAIRKDIFDKLKVRRVETNEYKAVTARDRVLPTARSPASRCATVHDDTTDCALSTDDQSPAFCLPLQELDVVINSSIKVPAILDTGSQIVIVRSNIVQALGASINHQNLIEMEGANGSTNWTLGCAENLILQVGDVSFKTHAHVLWPPLGPTIPASSRLPIRRPPFRPSRGLGA